MRKLLIGTTLTLMLAGAAAMGFAQEAQPRAYTLVVSGAR